MTNIQKAVLASYGRSFLAAVLAAFLAMGGDVWALDADTLRALISAGVAAVIPVALRALNDKDPAFGKGAK
jgi:hypothetical protein